MLADPTAFEERVAVLEALQRAFARRDAEAIANLVHPDATLKLITTPGRRAVRGREGTLSYMGQIERRMIVATFESIEPAGSDAVLAVGRMQRQNSDHSLSDTPAYWLVRFRDGLIWQTQTFTSESHARAKAATLT